MTYAVSLLFWRSCPSLPVATRAGILQYAMVQRILKLHDATLCRDRTGVVDSAHGSCHGPPGVDW